MPLSTLNINQGKYRQCAYLRACWQKEGAGRSEGRLLFTVCSGKSRMLKSQKQEIGTEACEDGEVNSEKASPQGKADWWARGQEGLLFFITSFERLDSKSRECIILIKIKGSRNDHDVEESDAWSPAFPASSPPPPSPAHTCTLVCSPLLT